MIKKQMNLFKYQNIEPYFYVTKRRELDVMLLFLRKNIYSLKHLMITLHKIR